jgi:Ca2+-binding EF-hand superfamily protein
MILTSNYNTEVVQEGTLVITPEQCLQGSIIYNELEAMMPIIPIVLQKHVIGAWLQIRNEVLGKVAFPQYITILENKFVSPATARKAEWIHAMLSVL